MDQELEASLSYSYFKANQPSYTRPFLKKQNKTSNQTLSHQENIKKNPQTKRRENPLLSYHYHHHKNLKKPFQTLR